jgi:hypothetical protein
MHTEATRRVEVDAERPVFVAGPDRSGTTLMYALLASHPQLCMVRRTNMWRYFYERYGDLGDAANLEKCLSDMLRYRRLRHLDPDAARIRREFASGPRTYARLFALFHVHNAERATKPRWGDKSLHTEHFADHVFRAFPDARVVQMVRDPRDRYASVRYRNGRQLSRVGPATGRWLRSARAATRGCKRYPGRYLIVRYEDVVRDPEATMRRVCAFVDLPFAVGMLGMEAVPEIRDSGGNSSFGDMEPRAISNRAIGRFRSVLPARDVAFIQLTARRRMDRLGYVRESTRLGVSARMRFLFWDVPVGWLRMVGWMLHARLRQRRAVRVPESRLDSVGEEV